MPELDERTKEVLLKRLKELVEEGKMNSKEADNIKEKLFPMMGGKKQRKTKRANKKQKNTRKSRSWW
jgi:hypothetical protein